jgi:hypothetical protein
LVTSEISHSPFDKREGIISMATVTIHYCIRPFEKARWLLE